MKRVIPILAFLFLLVIALPALAVTEYEWPTPQYDNQHTANIAPSAFFLDNISSADSISFNVGDNNPPLAADMNADGQPELLIFDSNYLEITQVTVTLGEVLTLEGSLLAEFNVQSPLQTYASTFEYPDGTRAWVGIANNEFHALAYNSQTDAVYRTYPNAHVRACDRWEGVQCDSSNCYALCENRTMGNLGAVKFAMLTNTTTITNVSNMTLRNTSVVGEPAQPFALDDIDGDNNNEIVYACDANIDKSYGVCVIDTSTMNLDTYFSGDGIIDGITLTLDNNVISGDIAISAPMVEQLNGAGDKEIVVGLPVSYAPGVAPCTGGTYKAGQLRAISGSGTTLWTTTNRNIQQGFLGCPASAGAESHMLTPFIAFSNGTRLVCSSNSHASGGLLRGDGCVVGSTGAFFTARDAVAGRIQPGIQSGFSFARNVTGNQYDYVMIGEALYRFNTTAAGLVTVDSTVDAFTTSYSTIGADLTNDLNLDIIGSISGTTTTVTILSEETATDDLPELNNSMASGGYFGYFAGTTCKGTTAVFGATECPGTGQGCNYNNDLSTNAERLVTDCGTGTFTQGNFNFTEPRASCVYNETGTFNVRIYLQENTHPSDLSQFNTNDIIINVIDGVPGSTCNLALTFVGNPGDAPQTPPSTPEQDAVDESIDATLGILFGTSAKLKLLVAIGIILAIMYGVAKELKNAFMTGAAGIITMVGMVFLGLLPVYVMILFFVGLLLIILLAKFIVGGSESGGGG